jgi:hypothetical protein
VRAGETSASEPLMTCRNSQDGVETGGKVVASRMSSGGALTAGPSGARLGGGVNPGSGSVAERGNLSSRCEGTARGGRRGSGGLGSPDAIPPASRRRFAAVLAKGEITMFMLVVTHSLPTLCSLPARLQRLRSLLSRLSGS